MGLKKGSLASLVGKNKPIEVSQAQLVFKHMLQALDYISNHGITHRDVKPQNILYEEGNNGFNFQLADFGLCNDTDTAQTEGKGSPLYRAPEMTHSNTMQTDKVDMWSLFVTMLDILHREFHQIHFTDHYDGIHLWVIDYARKSKILSSIQEAANFNPEDRASAAQMLLKHFNGEGMCTPLNKVPPMKPFSVNFVPRQQVNAAQAQGWAQPVAPRQFMGNNIFGGGGFPIPAVLQPTTGGPPLGGINWGNATPRRPSRRINNGRLTNIYQLDHISEGP